jgi:hypothetical protein
MTDYDEKPKREQKPIPAIQNILRLRPCPICGATEFQWDLYYLKDTEGDEPFTSRECVKCGNIQLFSRE